MNPVAGSESTIRVFATGIPPEPIGRLAVVLPFAPSTEGGGVTPRLATRGHGKTAAAVTFHSGRTVERIGV